MARTSPALKKYEEATAAYLHNLEHTGAAPLTVRNYASRLANFLAFWSRKNEVSHSAISDPSYTDVQAWRDDLLDQGCKLSTVRQYLKELNMFFTWASDPSLGASRWYEASPVSPRLIPDTRKLEARPYDQILTDEQVMLLWRNNPPKGLRAPQYWARNYAIVVLLLATEIRNAELLSLRLCDLDFVHSELTVVSGKGGKFRVIDFPLIAQTAIRLYLNWPGRPKTLTNQDYLFGTQGVKGEAVRNGQPDFWKRGTPQWLSAVVERHVYAITRVHGVRTHDLRHVGARLDLNNGMTFEELQAKLGHANFGTTQRYSGKLVHRRRRQSARLVYDERARQAARNAEVLSHIGS